MTRFTFTSILEVHLHSWLLIKNVLKLNDARHLHCTFSLRNESPGQSAFRLNFLAQRAPTALLSSLRPCATKQSSSSSSSSFYCNKACQERTTNKKNTVKVKRQRTEVSSYAQGIDTRKIHVQCRKQWLGLVGVLVHHTYKEISQKDVLSVQVTEVSVHAVLVVRSLVDKSLTF